MSGQLERVIRSLRHLWAQPDATIEQFAAEAVAALRPELEDARFQRDIVQQCFMLLEIACSGDERRVKFDALKAQYEVAAQQEGNDV
jgi:hypothetical protein